MVSNLQFGELFCDRLNETMSNFVESLSWVPSLILLNVLAINRVLVFLPTAEYSSLLFGGRKVWVSAFLNYPFKNLTIVVVRYSLGVWYYSVLDLFHTKCGDDFLLEHMGTLS